MTTIRAYVYLSATIDFDVDDEAVSEIWIDELDTREDISFTHRPSNHVFQLSQERRERWTEIINDAVRGATVDLA